MFIFFGDKSVKGIFVYFEMFDIDVSVIFGGFISELYVCVFLFLKLWGVSKVLIGWNKKGYFKVLIEIFWL